MSQHSFLCERKVAELWHRAEQSQEHPHPVHPSPSSIPSPGQDGPEGTAASHF